MFLPGIITKGEINLPSTEMLLITVRESRFFSTLTYIFLIFTSTTTLSSAEQAIQHLISFILCIYFPLLMPVYSSASLYSFLNQLQSFFSV
jgi:hypothetical protein